MEEKAKAYLAECYVLLDKLPDEHKKTGWALLAATLSNVNGALSAPASIRPNLGFQADVAHRALALIEKLEKNGSEHDWSKA